MWEISGIYIFKITEMKTFVFVCFVVGGVCMQCMHTFVCTCRNHSNRDNIRFYHTMPIPLRQSLSLNLELGWQTASPRNLMVLLPPQSSELQVRTVNLFFVLCGLGFELKSSHLCCKYSYPQSHLQPPMLLFRLVIFIKALGSQNN